MRALLSLLLVGLVGAPASACPRGTACLAMQAQPRELAAPVARPRPVLQMRQLHISAPEDRHPALRSSVQRRGSDEPEMPWIWQALRDRVYSQLPGHRSETVTITLAPVVVQGQFDTVPGFGVSGAF